MCCDHRDVRNVARLVKQSPPGLPRWLAGFCMTRFRWGFRVVQKPMNHRHKVGGGLIHTRLVPWLLLGVGLCVLTTTAAEPLAGKPFEAALDHRIGRAWGGQDANSLRDVVRQLAESERVSILLDRRIDPTQSIELTMPPTPLRDLLAALARKGEAGMSVVGNVVYLGPADSAKKLRTLVELRQQDLLKLTSSAKTSKSPWRNRPSLTAKRTFAWQDLDRPRDVLKQVAHKFQIEIEGLDEVPHDLWAASSLPQVTAVEALSLLLVPFGSTFEFLPDRAAIRMVPIPPSVVVERSHLVLANSPVILEAARKQFADCELEQSGAKLIVRGTVERHEEIAVWLRPKKTDKPSNTNLRKPLNERLISLNQKNVALGDVVKTFTEYGVRILYDADELAAAGVKLDDKIELNAKDVSIEKLFRDLFEARGIEVTVDGDEIRLRPKPK